MFSGAAHAAPAAEDGSGWYGGVFALGGFTDQSNFKQDPNRGTPVTGKTDTAGLSGGGGLWGGYNFGKENPFSLELATSVRTRHDLDIRYYDATVTPLGAKGNVTTVDLMLSGLYNINTGYKLTPYVGAGAGAVWNHSENQQLNPGSTVDADSSDSVHPAWQLQAGFNYPLSANTKLRFDYRYIDMAWVETSRLPSGDKLRADLTSQDVRIGVAWAF